MLYFVKYTDPQTDTQLTYNIEAEDKTQARDLFYELFTDVVYIDRITLIPV